MVGIRQIKRQRIVVPMVLALLLIVPTDANAQRRPATRRGSLDANGNAVWTPSRTIRARDGGIGTGVVDSQGRPRGVGAERRITGPYGNAAQRRTRPSSAGSTRRFDRTAGFISSRLGSNVRGRLGYGRFRFRDPLTGATIVRDSLKAYDQYSGFGARSVINEAADLSTIISRRYSLIEASSGIAPVRRVLASGAMPRIPFDKMPAAGDEPHAPIKIDEQGGSLSERLSRNMVKMSAEVKESAWTAFKEGDYHTATRRFESLATLEPKNLEPAIGVLLCDLSRGSVRTAMSQLRSITRMFGDPFSLPVSFKDRFLTENEARELLVRCRLIADATGSLAAGKALYVMTAWYTGNRDDARTAADALIVSHPGSAFQSWPALMGKAPSVRP